MNDSNHECVLQAYKPRFQLCLGLSFDKLLVLGLVVPLTDLVLSTMASRRFCLSFSFYNFRLSCLIQANLITHHDLSFLGSCFFKGGIHLDGQTYHNSDYQLVISLLQRYFRLAISSLVFYFCT